MNEEKPEEFKFPDCFMCGEKEVKREDMDSEEPLCNNCAFKVAFLKYSALVMNERRKRWNYERAIQWIKYNQR